MRTSLILTVVVVLISCQKLDLKETINSVGDPRMFLTSRVTTGSMGFGGAVAACNGSGIQNANCVCNSLGKNAHAISLGTGTDFRAWLSTSLVDAICNIQGFSQKTANCPIDREFTLRTLKGANFTGLLNLKNGESPALVDITDELGNIIDKSISSFFSGSNANGIAAPTHCADFSTTTGFGEMRNFTTISGWLTTAVENCANTRPILCIQQLNK